MTDTKAYEPPTIKRADDSNVEQLLIFSTEQPNPDYDPNLPSPEGSSGDNPPTIVTHYTMPNKPNVGLALAYLKMARSMGTELAGSWLIESAMGSEAYDALAAEPDLTPEELSRITEKVQKVAMGGLEGPKGS